MSKIYDQLGDYYDPYTAAPYYQYLFSAPNGISPQNPITNSKVIEQEIKDPGTTTVYNSLPPPPKKYGITTSEAFGNTGQSDSMSIDPYTIFIIILVLLVFMLVLRVNKVIKKIKKLQKDHGGRKDHKTHEI